LREYTLDRDGCRIHIVGVVKGLKSEAENVRRAFDNSKPDKVAISISKEELEGLRNMPEDFEPELSRYEEIYVEGLSRFGEVAAPPPCYIAALELAEHSGKPVVPVDMDEQSYTDLYCAMVGGSSLFRHSTRTWILKRRSFDNRNAEDFVLAWDRAVNNLECFKTIERRRAEAMAKGIIGACAGSGSVLAVVELERASDVRALLQGKTEK
jgi:pheromone shutdown protein TraB